MYIINNVRKLYDFHTVPKKSVWKLIDELNVTENVELPLMYMGVPAKARHERVKEVLRRVMRVNPAEMIAKE